MQDVVHDLVCFLFATTVLGAYVINISGLDGVLAMHMLIYN
jgi:hypothetical protein